MADDLVERTMTGETVAGMEVLGWMTEIDIPGIGTTRRTDYHWSTPSKTAKVTRLVDAEEARARILALEAERDAALDKDWVSFPAYEAALRAGRDFRTRATTAEARNAELEEALKSARAALRHIRDSASPSEAWISEICATTLTKAP